MTDLVPQSPAKQANTWGQWFRDQYDKHLLLVLFALSMAFYLWIMTNFAHNEGAVDWARSKADQVLGGLMTLIAGKLWNETRAASKTDSLVIQTTHPKEDAPSDGKG